MDRIRHFLFNIMLPNFRKARGLKFRLGHQ
jgi:hypothetical protein